MEISGNFAAEPFGKSIDSMMPFSKNSAWKFAEKASPITRTAQPSVTGTSVLGLMYDKGVMISADTLGSYGSLARFPNCDRVLKVNDQTVLGVGGDYADFQFLMSIIEQHVIDEECLNDGFSLKPRSLYCWLTRTLYNRLVVIKKIAPLRKDGEVTIPVMQSDLLEQWGDDNMRKTLYLDNVTDNREGLRTKFDPLWNVFIVGGMQDGVPFLGHVDKIGTSFECPTIATGYGSYLAQPLLRTAYENNPKLTEQEARALMIDCMRVLYYRDCRAFPKYTLAIVNESGTKVEGPFELDTHWPSSFDSMEGTG